MPTGVKPALRAASSAASRSSTLNVRWCGPHRARDETREEVVALGVPGFEQLDLHAAVEIADEHLNRAKAERLPSRQHGPAEHAGEEAQRRRGVGRGERDVIEIGAHCVRPAPERIGACGPPLPAVVRCAIT